LLYIEQKYGGHLGFYEGGLIYPNPLTWLDRTVVDLATAVTAYATCEKAELILGQENG
jgi:predicted alpha/beta-fold hydrolase